MAEKNTKNVQRQQAAPARRRLRGIPTRHGKEGKNTPKGHRQRTEWPHSMGIAALCSSRTADAREDHSSRATTLAAAAAEQRGFVSRVRGSSEACSGMQEGPKGS